MTTKLPSLEELKKTVSGWLVKKKKEQKKKSGLWKWVVGLGVAAVSLITLAILAFVLWKKGRELAKLKHERDVRKQQEKRSIVELRLATNSKIIEKHRDRAADLNIRVSEIDAKLETVKEDEERAKGKIDAIKNWEDVDRFLSGDATSASSDSPT